MSSFSNVFFETFLILRWIERDITIYAHTSSCKAPAIFAKF
jgi:hypothetical protein